MRPFKFNRNQHGSLKMLLTMNLNDNETQAYAARRATIRGEALRLARKAGRRFAQIVGTDGRILDVLEAQ